MTTRVINKVLAAREDLALGQGTVAQTRQGASVSVNQIDLPWVNTTVLQIAALDTTKIKHCMLSLNSTFRFYRYDAASAETADNLNYIDPDVGAGQWVLAKELQDVYNVDTVAELTSLKNFAVGDKIRVSEYVSGNRSGAMEFETVAAATGTDNGGSFIDHDTEALQFKQLFPEIKSINKFGAIPDDNSPATVAINNAVFLAVAAEGGAFELGEGVYTISSSIVFGSNTWIVGNGIGRTVIKADSTAYGSGASMLSVGDVSNERTEFGIMDLTLDITDADTTAVAFDKVSCNRFKFSGKIKCITGTSTQSGLKFQNGTHCDVPFLMVEGGFRPLDMQNPDGKECHSTLFGKVTLQPADIVGSRGLSSAGDASFNRANVTFNELYVESSPGTNVDALYVEKSPNMRIKALRLDGSFNYQWNFTDSARMIIDQMQLDSIAKDSPTQFAGAGRTVYLGRQSSQVVENFLVLDRSGNEQFKSISTTTTFYKDGTALTVDGASITSGGKGVFVTDGEESLILSRKNSDGQTLRFYQGTSEKNAIVINGATTLWDDPHKQPNYSVAGVPAAASYQYSIIFVTGTANGDVPCYSDGTDWRYCSSDAVIST